MFQGRDGQPVMPVKKKKKNNALGQEQPTLMPVNKKKKLMLQGKDDQSVMPVKGEKMAFCTIKFGASRPSECCQLIYNCLYRVTGFIFYEYL